MPIDRPSPVTPEWTDTRLIQFVLAGNPEAGIAFVDRFEKLIFTVLVRQCGVREEHQVDAYRFVIEKLFEDGCRRLKDWRGESRLSTFLAAVVRDLGVDYKDSQGGGTRHAGDEGDDAGQRKERIPAPVEEADVHCMEEVIHDLAGSLEEPCRKVVYLRFEKGMSYKEIALAAGLPVGGVVIRLHRCLETLAQLMKRRFPHLFEDRFHLDM